MIPAFWGRFGDTSTRPYVEGKIILPDLHREGGISFLLDTGADQTLLMPDDWQRLNLDYSKLTGSMVIGGLGGDVTCGTARCVAVFTEPGKQIHFYVIEIAMAPLHPHYAGMASILGRDIFDHWQFLFNAKDRILEIEVLDATDSIPIPIKK